MKKVICYIVIFFMFHSLNAQWEFISGPDKGSISAIAINDENLIVCAGTTVYLSTNNGEDWSAINNGFRDFDAFSSIVSYNDNIYIGTRGGLFLSTDMGKNWQLSNSMFKSNYITDLAQNGNNIYLVNHDVHFSNNGGESWVKIDTSIFFGHPTVLKFIDEKLFVGCDNSEWKTKAKIYITSNNGGSWKSLGDSLSGLTSNTITCLTARDSLIFAGTKAGLFISTNNGDNWYLANNDGLKSFEIKSLTFCDNNIFAASAIYLFLSTDFGASWNSINSPKESGKFRILKSDGSNVYLGTTRGLYFSSDTGATWNSINKGLGGAVVFDIVADNSKIYVGTWKYGMFTTDNTEENNWTVLTDYTKNHSIYKLAVSENNIFAGLWGPGGGLIYSNDNGVSWDLAETTSGLKNSRVQCFAIDKENIFVGTYRGVYTSTNYGESWNSLSPNLEIFAIKSIAIKDSNIYIGKDKVVWRSTDYGKSWSSSYIGLPDASITCLTINDGNIFAGTYAGNKKPGYGVFISTDSGDTWEEVNNGFNEPNVYSFATIENNIFASTDEGVYLTANNGESWSNVSDGLNSNDILKVLIVNDNIYATASQGVFKAKFSDFGITSVDENTIEGRNYLYAFPPYPMPARDYVRSHIYWDTSIDFDNEDIAVYNIFGLKVAGKERINIDKQTNYSGILTWDCSDVISGIYFIQIEHGTKSWTLKVMVNR